LGDLPVSLLLNLPAKCSAVTSPEVSKPSYEIYRAVLSDRRPLGCPRLQVLLSQGQLRRGVSVTV